MIFKKYSWIALFAAAALCSQAPRAAVIAVVDSGTDLDHPDLVKKAWNNPGEQDDGVDNDDNGYVDDLHGWNIPDNNNRLVDKKLIGTFPPDAFKYFEFQTKLLNGVATDDEKAWLKAKVSDASFLEMLEAFANHIHGTHVAGISAKNADMAQIMVLRMIGGSEPNSVIHGLSSIKVEENSTRGIKDKLIFLALDALASAQGKGVAPVGAYIADKKAQVANCSFGASRRSIEPVIKPLIEKVLGTPLTDEQLHVYADYFLTKTAASMKAALIDPSKTTLFVVAAGNDGTDNDVAPTAPANAKADNEITVAATLGTSKLASFSNFGATMVDIAAPGVGILSTIPGGQYMTVSGTSQASPFVANLAGRVIDANGKLSVVDVKRILMETVDKKDFLVKKVRSEGIANPERALYAAQLSQSMPLEDAIGRANRDVHPVMTTFEEIMMDDSELTVLPLPSFIR